MVRDFDGGGTSSGPSSFGIMIVMAPRAASAFPADPDQVFRVAIHRTALVTIRSGIGCL